MNHINTLAYIAKINGIEATNRLRNDIVSEYTDIIDSLNTIEESIIVKDISLIPIYQINESCIEEGYAIDLDSLKYVIESKKVTLKEAIQEIRDINYIGDTYPMYCVLPKDINKSISLESFVNINKALINSDITPICTKYINESEFINEALKIDNWNEDRVKKLLSDMRKI